MVATPPTPAPPSNTIEDTGMTPQELDLSNKRNALSKAHLDYNILSSIVSHNVAALEMKRRNLDQTDPNAIAQFNGDVGNINQELKSLDAAREGLSGNIDDYNKFVETPQLRAAQPPQKFANKVLSVADNVASGVRNLLSPILGPSESQKLQDSILWTGPDGETSYRYKPLGGKVEQAGMLPTAISLAADIPERGAKGIIAPMQDVVNKLIPGSSDRDWENMRALTQNQSLPREQIINSMSGPAKWLSKAATVDLPSIIGRTAAASISGGTTTLSQAVANGVAFGVQQDGSFDPYQGALMAALPTIGRIGEQAVADAINSPVKGGATVLFRTDRFGNAMTDAAGQPIIAAFKAAEGKPYVNNDFLRKVLEKIVGNGGAQVAAMEIAQMPQIAQLPPDQQKDAIVSTAGYGFLFALLHMPGVVDSRITSTGRNDLIRSVFYDFDNNHRRLKAGAPEPQPGAQPNATQTVPVKAIVPSQRQGTDEVGQPSTEAGAGNSVPGPAGQPAAQQQPSPPAAPNAEPPQSQVNPNRQQAEWQADGRLFKDDAHKAAWIAYRTAELDYAQTSPFSPERADARKRMDEAENSVGGVISYAPTKDNRYNAETWEDWHRANEAEYQRWQKAGDEAAKSNPQTADLVKQAIADAKKNGPSPEFRALFGGIDPALAGTTPEKVAAFAKTLGMTWRPVTAPASDVTKRYASEAEAAPDAVELKPGDVAPVKFDSLWPGVPHMGLYEPTKPFKSGDNHIYFPSSAGPVRLTSEQIRASGFKIPPEELEKFKASGGVIRQEKKEEAPAPPQPPKGEGFTTSKGSQYTIDPKTGQTTRLKMSEGSGKGEIHEPMHVVFLTPKQHEQVLEAAQNGDRIILTHKKQDGNFVQLRPGNGDDIRGVSDLHVSVINRTTGEHIKALPATTEPKVGLHPFEIAYEGENKRFHLGNEITHITKQPAPPASPQKPGRTMQEKSETQKLVEAGQKAGRVEVIHVTGTPGRTMKPKPAPLATGQTEISKDQALAICGGSSKLLPQPGETKVQPSDATGEYMIGQTQDGRYFTQHIPKEQNVNEPSKSPGGDVSTGGAKPEVAGPTGATETTGPVDKGPSERIQPGVRPPDAGQEPAGGGVTGGEPNANTDDVPAEQTPKAAEPAGTEPSGGGTEPVSGKSSGAADKTATPFIEPGHRNIVLTSNPAPTGATARVKANIEAIKLVKELEESGTFPTEEQRAELAKWSGWGSFKEMFNDGRAEKRDWDQSWMRTYGKSYDTLRKLLTPEEFDAAAESSVNAHYTSQDAVVAMWDLVRRLGYKGGRALEPSTGSGVFIGYGPEDLLGNTRWTGVEMEPITGKIFSYLYPEVDMRIQPYEKAKLPNGFYDLVMTNVPFHEIGPGGEYPSMNLHNYYIARSLDKAKPGGLVVVITTKGTMDQQQGQRSELVEKGQLVGAIRLPNNAFKESAATAVVTDILVIRKPDGKPFDHSQPWEHTGEVDTPQGMTRINEYFVAHPEMVLGSNALTGTMYRDKSYTVEGHGELGPKLAAAIAKFPENITQQEGAPETKESTQTKMEDYTLVLDKGRVMESRNFQLELPSWNSGSPNLVERAKLYIALRDRLKAQYKLEADPASTPEQIEEHRLLLRKEYQAMTKSLGEGGKGIATVNQNDRKMGHLQTDPDYYTVMGIEVFKEVQDPKDVNNTITVAEPSDVLSKRVIQPDVPPEKAANASEAMAVSLAYKGEVDIEYIKQLTGLTDEQIESELIAGGLGFKDPETGLFASLKEYLTGDVREKLQKAIFAAKESPAFQPNVDALKKVIPPTDPFNKIAFDITSRWIPPEVISKFAEKIMGLPPKMVSFLAGVESFNVKKQDIHKASELTKTQWMTKDMPATELLDHALNFKRAQIMRRTHDDKYVEDKDASALNNQIISKIKREFDGWSRTNKETLPYRYFDGERGEYVTKDLPIWDLLEREYNRTKNSFIVPDNDGSMLKLPGLSNMVRRTPHLLSGVMRAIVDGSAVFGHGTGSGKTFLLTVIAHELQRIGLMKKAPIVVKKPTVAQYRVSIERAYPGSKVLIPTKKDFEPANRRTLAARIASGKWDFIILTHEQFKAIRTTEESVKAFFDDQIEQLKKILRDMGENDQVDAKTSTRGKDPAVRNLIKKIKSLKKQLDKHTTSIAKKQDVGLYWEELGIDGVLIDESHNFKKMPIPTQMTDVKGIPNDFSQRAVDLLIKLRDIQRKTNGRNVFFASGTPVSNTLAELWVMFHATNPKMLEQFGVKTFDSFATTFADVVSNFEFGWDNKFKEVTRMSRFKNAGALTTLTRLGMDVKIGNKELGLDVPDFEGGKPITRIIKPTKAFERWLSFLDDVVEEWEMLDPKGRFENSWVPIATMRLGVASALDPRCAFADADDDPNSKVNQCVRDIMDEWEKGKERKTTMMVFADMYGRMNSDKLRGFLGHSPAPAPTELEVPEAGETPEGEEDKDPSDTGAKDDADAAANFVGDFNIYNDIRAKLIKAGVPAYEIAIITEHDTDTKRESLFNKVRAGIVRVLMGSTEKIGEGVDVPQRMSAQFHLDPPMQMTPAKMEQRLGRIIRQGNLHSPKNWNLPVRAYLYAMEKSMDAAIYQMLETKSVMVTQALKGKFLGDSFEDPAGALTLAMAEMKAAATGDPRYLEMAKLQKDVRELTMEQGAYYQRHSELERNISQLKDTVSYRKHDAENYKKIGEAMAAAWGDENTAYLQYTNKEGKVIKSVGYKAIDATLEQFHKGFQKQLDKEKAQAQITCKIGDNLHVEISGRTEKSYTGELGTRYSAAFFIGKELTYYIPRWDSDIASAESVLNAGRNIPKNADLRRQKAEQEAAEAQNAIPAYEQQLANTHFDKADELNQKRHELSDLERTLAAESKNRKRKKATELFKTDDLGKSPVYSKLLDAVEKQKDTIAALQEKYDTEPDVDKREAITEKMDQADKRLAQLQRRLKVVETARLKQSGNDSPYRMTTNQRGVEGSLDTATDSKIILPPQSAKGEQSIREMLLDPNNGLSPEVRAVAAKALEIPGLDWDRMTAEILPANGQFNGAAYVKQMLIQLTTNARPESLPHEVLHFLLHLLPKEYLDGIEASRLEALKKIFGDNVPEDLASGDMTSDEYVLSPYYDKEGTLYHLINAREYFAGYGGKRFAEENAEPQGGAGGKDKSWWQAFADKVKGWIKALVDLFRKKGANEKAYDDLMAGKFTPTPETGMDADDVAERSLVRSSEEYQRRQALGEKGTAEGTAAAYGSLAKMKYEVAKSLNASDRAMAILNIPRQRALADVAFKDTGLESYYDVRAQFAQSSPYIRAEIALSAYHLLGNEQRRSMDIQKAADKQAAYLMSAGFKQKFKRWMTNEAKLDALKEAEETFKNQIGEQAAAIIKEMEGRKLADAKSEQLASDLKRVQSMVQFSKAVSQRVQQIVDLLASHPEGLKLLLYGVGKGGGTELANKYFSMSSDAGNPITGSDERAFVQLASQVIAANRDMRRTLSLLSFAKDRPDFQAELSKVGKTFAGKMEKDPEKAINWLVKTAGRLTEARTSAEAAWLMLNKNILKQVEQHVDLQQAVAVDQALKDSPTWRKLVNDVHTDAKAVRFPDEVIKQMSAGEGFDEFESRPTLLSPKGNTYQIDLGVTKKDALGAWESVKSYLNELDEWLRDPANTDSPDRKYWQSRRDFVEAVYYVSTTSRPTAIEPRLASHSWWIPDYLFDQMQLPHAKVARISMENFGASFNVGDGWVHNKQEQMVNANALAAKSHGYSTTHELRRWQEDVLDYMGYIARTGKKVSVGDVTDDGIELTKEDIAALKTQGASISNLINSVRNVGREKVMKDKLLVDQWADNMFGIREAHEIGGEVNTTLPHSFSDRGKVLARIISGMMENGASKADIKSVLDQSNNFSFVRRFMGQRRASFIKQLSPFEDQYRELAQKIHDHADDAPTSIDDIVDYLDNNTTDEFEDREAVENQLLAEITGRLSRFFKKYVEPSEADATRVWRTETSTAMTRGFVADVENSFFYNYGLVTDGDIRAMANDASNYHLVRVDKALDSLEQECVKALDAFKNSGRTQKDRKEWLKAARERHASGEDFRNFDLLESQLQQIRDFRQQVPSWSGNKTVEAALVRRGSRLIQDYIQAKLSGVATAARILAGSTIKVGQVFSAMDRNIALSTARGITSMAMSAFKIAPVMGVNTIGRGFYNAPSVWRALVWNKNGIQMRLAESVRASLEGLTEEMMRPSKYLRQQYQLGLITDGMLGHKLANMIMMPQSRGRGYEPAMASNRLVRIPANIGNIILTAVELPIEVIASYLPKVAYNIAYDAAARQAGWTIDMLEAAARRAFDIHEKMGTLERFNLDDPSDPVNALRASEVLPRGLVPKTQTDLAQVREWFRALDLPYDEAVIKFWKKLSETPKNERKSVRLLGDKDQAERRAMALMAVALRDVHHAAPTNRPWILRQVPVLRVMSPFVGWSAQSTRQILSTFGKAPHDPNYNKWWLRAIALAYIAAAAGISILNGDGDKRFQGMAKRFAYNEQDSVKHLGQGQSAGENARIAVSDAISYISFLNTVGNSLLGLESTRGGMNLTPLILSEANAFMNLAQGMIHTKDFSYGLSQFVANQMPLSKVVLNRLPSQTGLVQEKDARNILTKYGPEDLLRNQGGTGYDVPVPTPLTPYKQTLANAIFSGDQQAIQQAFDDFEKKATDIGRPNPDKLAKEVFESLNPYRQVFGTVLSEEQRQSMLANMSPNERQTIEGVEARYEQAGSTLGQRTAMTREEVATARQGAGTGQGAAGVPNFAQMQPQAPGGVRLSRSTGFRGSGSGGRTIGAVRGARTGAGRSFVGGRSVVGTAKARLGSGVRSMTKSGVSHGGGGTGRPRTLRR